MSSETLILDNGCFNIKIGYAGSNSRIINLIDYSIIQPSLSSSFKDYNQAKKLKMVREIGIRGGGWRLPKGHAQVGARPSRRKAITSLKISLP
uniref:Uncharacterized protein n=1 Tax=Meloidogyne incognita TaxID=6306 RepID=A0A914MT26_MELIC